MKAKANIFVFQSHYTCAITVPNCYCWTWQKKERAEQAIRIIITEKSVINFSKAIEEGNSRKSESNCFCSSSGRFRIMRARSRWNESRGPPARQDFLSARLMSPASWLINVMCWRGGSTNGWIIKMRFPKSFHAQRFAAFRAQPKTMFPDSSQNIATTQKESRPGEATNKREMIGVVTIHTSSSTRFNCETLLRSPLKSV